MAIAIFNDQQTLAGQRLGISTAKALTLTVMAFGLGCMNIYHMGNAVTNKLLTPDSSIFLFALLYFIAACIAFIEVPITEEIVTTEAQNGKGSAKGHRLLLIVVAAMAVAGGVYSITSDAEKVDNQRTAHDTQNSSFEDLKQGLIADRNAARKQALSFDSESQRQIETSRANSDYFKALAKLKNQQSGHQSTRPTETVETGSVWHWFWTMGFSLVCSLGVIAITAHLTKYHKPLTEIPRVFFKVKEEQEWQMKDDDVRVIPAQVDLTGSASTTPARPILSTPETTQNQEPAPDQIHPTPNRPEQGHANAGAVFGGTDTASDRPLNDDDERAVKTDYSGSHYEAVRRAIIIQEITPAQKPVMKKLIELNVKLASDSERTKLAIRILDTLKGDGVILDNPKFGNSGGKVVGKFTLNPEYLDPEFIEEDAYWWDVTNRLERGDHVDSLPGEDANSTRKPQGWAEYDARQLDIALRAPATTEKITGGTVTRSGHMMAFMPDDFGDEMIKSTCPECEHQSSVSETNLKKWGGVVGCPECRTEYNPTENLS